MTTETETTEKYELLSLLFPENRMLRLRTLRQENTLRTLRTGKHQNEERPASVPEPNTLHH